MDILTNMLAPVTGPMVTHLGVTELQATGAIIAAAALLIATLLWKVVSGPQADTTDLDPLLADDDSGDDDPVTDPPVADSVTDAGERPDPDARHYGTPAPAPRRIDGWHNTLWDVRDVITTDIDRLGRIAAVTDTIAQLRTAHTDGHAAVADAEADLANAQAHLADADAAIAQVDAEIADIDNVTSNPTAPPDAASTLSALAADPTQPAPPLGDQAADRDKIVTRLQERRQEATAVREQAAAAVEDAQQTVARLKDNIPDDPGDRTVEQQVAADAAELAADMHRGDAAIEQFERYLTWLHAPDEVDSPRTGDLTLLPSLFRTMFRDVELLYARAADELGDLMPDLDAPADDIADGHSHAVDLLRQLLAAAHTLHAAVEEATRVGVLHPFHERLEEIRDRKAQSVGKVEDVLARYDHLGALIDEGAIDEIGPAAAELRESLEPARDGLVAVATEIAEEAAGLATVTDELHELRSGVLAIAEQFDQLRASIDGRLEQVDAVLAGPAPDDGPADAPDMVDDGGLADPGPAGSAGLWDLPDGAPADTTDPDLGLGPDADVADADVDPDVDEQPYTFDIGDPTDTPTEDGTGTPTGDTGPSNLLFVAHEPAAPEPTSPTTDMPAELPDDGPLPTFDFDDRYATAGPEDHTGQWDDPDAPLPTFAFDEPDNSPTDQPATPEPVWFDPADIDTGPATPDWLAPSDETPDSSAHADTGPDALWFDPTDRSADTDADNTVDMWTSEPDTAPGDSPTPSAEDQLFALLDPGSNTDQTVDSTPEPPATPDVDDGPYTFDIASDPAPPAPAADPTGDTGNAPDDDGLFTFDVPSDPPSPHPQPPAEPPAGPHTADTTADSDDTGSDDTVTHDTPDPAPPPRPRRSALPSSFTARRPPSR